MQPMAGMAHNPSLLSNKNINTIKFHIQTECKLSTTDISYPAIKHFLYLLQVVTDTVKIALINNK